ncbi:MAG: CvpA family protein [Planctomycetaceae bacterium]
MAVEGYDLVMIGILAVAALLGYFKGIVWQIAWIAGIAVSAFVAIRFATPVAPWFGQQAPWNRVLAMLALYAGTSLAVWVVFRLVSGFINAIHLSAFDHQLGLLMGAAKGALLCIVVTFFAVMLAPAYRAQIVSSRSGQIIGQIIVRADALLPAELHETVAPFVNQFERQFAAAGGRLDPAAGPLGGGGGAPGLSLESLFKGMGSMAAWSAGDAAAGPGGAGAFAGAGGGTGAGGVQQAGGPLPPGSSWFAPQPEAPAGQPVAFEGAAAAPPQRPAASRFTSEPAPPAMLPQPPAAFPIGAQSPLPRR